MYMYVLEFPISVVYIVLKTKVGSRGREGGSKWVDPFRCGVFFKQKRIGTGRYGVFLKCTET